MTTFVILFIMVTAVAGYFINKSTQSAEQQSQDLIDAVQDVAVEASVAAGAARTHAKIASLGQETKQRMMLEVFGADFRTEYAIPITKAPRLFSIRAFLQNISLSGEIEVIRYVRSLDDYPQSVLIQLRQDDVNMLMRIYDTSFTQTQVKNSEVFDVWKEEDGENIWVGFGHMYPRIYVDANCDETCSIESLKAILEACGTEVEEAPASHRKDSLKLHLLSKNSYGDQLVSTQMPAWNGQWQIFTSSYPGVLKVAGVKEVAIGPAVEKIVKNASSLSFHMVVDGKTGAGKTSFIRQVMCQAALQADAEGTYLKLIEWRPSTSADSPAELIARECGNSGRVLLIVEDTQLLTLQKFADLLNLLDGINSPQNLSSIVAFNPDEVSEEMKPLVEALTRPGRATLHVSLGELDKAQQATLVKLIRETHTHLVEVPGAVDALPEKIGLSQLWACFRKKAISDIL